MNKQKIKLIIFCFIGILSGLIFSSESLATTLPYGTVITDSKGVTIGTDGVYNIDITNVRPGKTYTKEIVLRSAGKVEPYDLGLRAEKVSSKGKIDWNKHAILTLTLDGKEIYQGPILGNGEFDWSKEGLSFGTFEHATEKTLKATIAIDDALTNKDFEESNQLLYKWTFIATRNGKEIEETKKDPLIKSPFTGDESGKKFFSLPKTGEEWREFIYKMIVGLLLLLIVLLSWKNRRRKNA